MDKPEKVKAIEKFGGRASVGIFVGYHLQPGGLWKHEIMLFRKADFTDFDFTRPRSLNELRPIRSQEFALTDRVPQFMLKAAYDVARRTLFQHSLIRLDKPAVEESSEVAPEPEEAPAPVAGGSEAEENRPTSGPSGRKVKPDGLVSPPVTAPKPGAPPNSALRHDPRVHEWKKDAK